MDRAEWQQIAEEKLHAADALLAAGEWASAYYLAGYAVECGLKSCVLVRLATTPHLIFEDKRYSLDCWTHKIGSLLKLAGLKNDLDTDITSNPAIGVHWMYVKDWNEESRYRGWTENEAKTLYNAIVHATDGVMTWIRKRW